MLFKSSADSCGHPVSRFTGTYCCLAFNGKMQQYFWLQYLEWPPEEKSVHHHIDINIQFFKMSAVKEDNIDAKNMLQFYQSWVAFAHLKVVCDTCACILICDRQIVKSSQNLKFHLPFTSTYCPPLHQMDGL